MKMTVGYYDFVRGFENARPNAFSRLALEALFDYLEQYEDDTGEEIEFDVIALCGEYTEYEDLEDFHKCYDEEDYPDLDTLEDHTQVIRIENTDGFIIQDF